jgi:hypothetical protein
MSEEEFLARWSRRKREARTDDKQDAGGPAQSEPCGPQSPTLPETRDPDVAEPDLSSLPPIDSIDAATDVTAFLRKGIPQELTRAALRRAWSADPAIRDFIGLAENAWDFNDPNAMPGFGPLDCTEAELSALVDRVVGGMRKAVEELPDLRAHPEDCVAPARDFEREPVPTDVAVDAPSAQQSAMPEQPTKPVAVQPAVVEEREQEEGRTRRRGHGGALPQ